MAAERYRLSYNATDVLSKGEGNPSVTAAPFHLPLHKGGILLMRDRLP